MQIGSLWSYIAKRILQGILLVFIVIVISFVLIHLAPGDPVALLVGPMGADPGYMEMMTKRFALDRPLTDQLFAYITGVFRGDFGISFYYLIPVMDLIVERAPHTLLLTATATTFALVLGIFLGIFSSTRRYSLFDYTSTIVSLVLYSIPTFWLGQILVLVFSVWLGWLPSGGYASFRTEFMGLDIIIDRLAHLVLPTITLGGWYLAIVTRLARSSMIEVLQSDFITFARSKGLNERNVIRKHVLKNAMIPVITVIGVSVSSMLTGAILTETIYSWPGLGRLLYEAILGLDYPVLMGLFIASSIGIIVITLAIDIVYLFIDPRIKYK